MARPSFVPPSDPTRDHLAAAHALSPGCSTRAYVDTLALLNQLGKDHVLQVSQFAHKISPSQPSPPPPNNPSSGCWAKRSYSWKASCLTTILHLQHLQFNLQHLRILHLWKHLTAISVLNIIFVQTKNPNNLNVNIWQGAGAWIQVPVVVPWCARHREMRRSAIAAGRGPYACQQSEGSKIHLACTMLQWPKGYTT